VGALAALLSVIFMSALDQTVLNTAIPHISTVLSGTDRGPWIITSYLLGATCATPVAGKLADIYGTKSVMVAVTIMFTLASALCGAAGLVPNLTGLDAMNQLIVSRLLQGIAGGAMIALCFIAIGDMFSPRERGKFQGVLAADFMVAALVGPVLGGWLVETEQWRLIFLLNLPVGILAAILFATKYPPSSRELAKAKIDWLGVLLFVLAEIPILLASTTLCRTGTFDVISVIEIVVSVISIVAFIIHERTTKAPLIPPSLFKSRLISISLVTVFITGIGFYGSMLLMAMILQEVNHLSATMSGAVLAPLMIVVAASSVVGGLVLSKTGRYKAMILAALGFMTAGSLSLAMVSAHSEVWLIPVAGSIGGIGLGLLLPIHSIIIQNAVADDAMGIATSMSNLFRSLGGTIGTGLMSAILYAFMEHGSFPQAVAASIHIYAASLAFAIVLNFFLPELELRKSKQS